MPGHKSAQNIESDSFDREVYGGLKASSEELRDVIDRGSNLLPSFPELTLDLFSSFYKHNVLFIDPEFVSRTGVLPRKILEQVHRDERYQELRQETVLDGFKSALAVVEIAENIYRWLRSDDGPGEKALINEHKAEQAEQEVEELKEEMETWEETEEKMGEGASDEFEEAKNERQEELDDAQEALDEIAEEQDQRHEKSDQKLKQMVRSSMRQTDEKIQEADDEIMSWSANMGAQGEKGVGEKLDLAAKLYKNEKLRKLSRIVGGLKEEMLSARKKTWAKRGTEVFDIASGDDIGRIIPSELMSLRHKFLRHDFKKRFIEGRLLQYYLKEEKGRGPMVVCLDGSSSMEGAKELWSKGVCLTLLEIAKRERRKFQVVVFSSGGQPLKIFESTGTEGSGWGMNQKEIFDLAEYFPGGGTNFEEPLNKALELLNESKFKGGDIVFITDGESNVGDMWLKSFEQEKERLKFKVYSVLIDLSDRESWHTLNHFSDKVTSVSQLTSKEARGLFLDI